MCHKLYYIISVILYKLCVFPRSQFHHWSFQYLNTKINMRINEVIYLKYMTNSKVIAIYKDSINFMFYNIIYFTVGGSRITFGGNKNFSTCLCGLINKVQSSSISNMYYNFLRSLLKMHIPSLRTQKCRSSKSGAEPRNIHTEQASG